MSKPGYGVTCYLDDPGVHCTEEHPGTAAECLEAVQEQRDALVRALLAVEWTQLDDGYDGCADCRRSKDGYSTVDHDNPCALDAALTAAGLPDQASRDEARRQIEARTNR